MDINGCDSIVNEFLAILLVDSNFNLGVFVIDVKETSRGSNKNVVFLDSDTSFPHVGVEIRSDRFKKDWVCNNFLQRSTLLVLLQRVRGLHAQISL